MLCLSFHIPEHWNMGLEDGVCMLYVKITPLMLTFLRLVADAPEARMVPSLHVGIVPMH